MTKNEFLVTHFYVNDDGEIKNGASSIMHSEEYKDILVKSLRALYEAFDVVQYHIYVEEVIDGCITKRIQHIRSE